MTNTKFLPLALLYVNGRRQIEGITRLQKLVFLAQQEQLGDESGYDFEPYKYGPYSEGLTEALETFEDRGYVQKEVETTRDGNEKYNYSLTSDGFRLVKQGMVGDNDYESLLEAAKAVKARHNQEPIEQLLRYVYNTYPTYAEKSELDI